MIKKNLNLNARCAVAPIEGLNEITLATSWVFLKDIEQSKGAAGEWKLCLYYMCANGQSEGFVCFKLTALRKQTAWAC